MARLLDREAAERLLSACAERTIVAAAAKATWDRELKKRAQAWLAANEGGLLVQEIAERCDVSVGLVKLEIGKAKKRAGTEAA